MNSVDIESRVREVVVRSLALEGQTIEMNDDLILHHGADELDIVKLGMDLEDAFNIDIDDDALGECRTLDYCVRAVKEGLKQRA